MSYLIDVKCKRCSKECKIRMPENKSIELALQYTKCPNCKSKSFVIKEDNLESLFDKLFGGSIFSK